MSEKASDDQNSELQRMITANKARLLQAQKTLSDLKKRTGEIPKDPGSEEETAPKDSAALKRKADEG